MTLNILKGYYMNYNIFRKMVIVAVILFIALPSLSPAQIISKQITKAGEDKTYELKHSVMFSKDDLIFDTLMGYDVVQLKDGSYRNELGKPLLPVKEIKIALPQGMTVTRVQVVDIERISISGLYTILPSQPPRKLNDNLMPFTEPDMRVYASDQLYPSSVVECVGQTDLAGQGMAVIRLSPVQYVPSEKKLFLSTSITFVVSGKDGYVCGDHLSPSISTSSQNLYESNVKEMVINPEDVQLHMSTTPQPSGVAPGDYDYVIITQSSWVSAFQPLADWKTKKGIPATIVTTTWIYNSGGYSGSNVNKIKAFVQDAYTNWGTIFVLLGGDIDVVPCNYRTFSSVDSGSVANDAYYADFDADWICEVHVGRASVTTTGTGVGGIGNFINKILTYEKNPLLTGYAKKAALFGFDLDSSTHAEQCKITIDNTYIPSSWTMSNVYDSQGGNHRTNVINAVNAGQNLINHADHSSSDYMGTGYINHNWGIYSSDVDAFNNGNKQSIFYSMGCDPAAYDSSNCIGEHFVRDNNGGGVAFVGNSRYGWYSYGSYNTYSMLFDTYFFRSLFAQNHYKLGDCFSDHKNDAYQNDDYYKYIFTELTLLGDPEMPIWTEDPTSLVVTYPAEFPIGSSTFTVHVTSGGNPVNQAYACLWKGNEVYLTGYTNSNGDIVFNPSPSTTGVMNVTVTKQNYLPYEGSANVIILCGDVNNDGVIDVNDVVYLIDYLFTGNPAPIPLVCAGDCNGGGTVNVADVVYLINYLFNAGPAPGGCCG